MDQHDNTIDEHHECGVADQRVSTFERRNDTESNEDKLSARELDSYMQNEGTELNELVAVEENKVVNGFRFDTQLRDVPLSSILSVPTSQQSFSDMDLSATAAFVIDHCTRGDQPDTSEQGHLGEVSIEQPNSDASIQHLASQQTMAQETPPLSVWTKAQAW